jgi:RNA polymerase sigma factor (sigma-70 family)
MTNRSNLEPEQVLEQYKALIIAQANFFNPKNADEREELIQVGTLSALSALKAYDPEKGKLSTFLTHCIRNSILSFIQKDKKTVELTDHAIEQSENFNEILPDLTEEEEKLINLKLMNYSRKQIAEEFGIDERVASYKLSKLYEKIRKANED